MIKRLLTTACVMIAGFASADIEVAWQASSGFYVNGSGPLPDDPGDYVGPVYGGITVQLIWSPDDQISEIDPFNAVNGYVSGGELQLTSIFVNGNDYGFHASGGVFEDANFDTGAVLLDQGYVYVRLFGDLTPTVGDYYFASTVVDPALRTEPPGSPTFIELNDNLVIGDELNRLIVPEPSVLAFLGLGGLLMAVRRRLK